MVAEPLKVFFIAGEASGDAHAASVVRELRGMEPGLEIRALGGPELTNLGVPSRLDFTVHAVMGVIPVLKNLPTFMRLLNETRNEILEWQPDVVVPVDFPGFNLRISRMVKAKGVSVCFYVSPQVWAWSPGRIHKIKRSVDHMMVLFDFEKALYEAIDAPVTFVGHPLFEALSKEHKRSNLRTDLGFKSHEVMVGLLPGSRAREIEGILPELVAAARIIAEKHPEVVFVVPIAGSFLERRVHEIIAERGHDLRIQTTAGRAHEVMARARVALTASGTATLELAYYLTPMVIVYKVTWLQKRLIPLLNLGYIGLVNILFGKELCLEFLDRRDRSEDIAAEALRLLKNGKRRKEVISGLRHVKQRVAVKGPARRAAKCILGVARRSRAKKLKQSQ